MRLTEEYDMTDVQNATMTDVQYAMQDILMGMLKLGDCNPMSADSHFARAVKTLNRIAEGAMPYTEACPLTEQTKDLHVQLDYCLHIA
jgi:hypothetical protein